MTATTQIAEPTHTFNPRPVSNLREHGALSAINRKLTAFNALSALPVTDAIDVLRRYFEEAASPRFLDEALDADLADTFDACLTEWERAA